ncbi:TetR/AcrR family transcriptional regulator [Phenylobacterium sp.]|uniref:TetR/AcrR family transcriptional regulator n=1 Tax=Phenylobacterium sp. TaxID=1871053 RepID=UPI00286CED24|nr:TetR/AcrR family transcriptional regulator [Phenylobacterium sp.]
MAIKTKVSIETADAGGSTCSPVTPDPDKGARRGRYITDTILARRRRILEAAKQAIAEGGPDAFTIRELGRRAKVSVTTIYATYGDKLGLIAAAIEDYYQSLPLARAPPTASLSALVASKDDVRNAILANRAYARQYAELYFSGSVDPRIYKVIRDTSTASGGHLPWLQKSLRDGDIVPGLSLDYLTTLFANHRLMVLHDWAHGRVSDDQLATALKMAFLIQARGVTRGRTLARVDAELKRLVRTATI